MSNQRESGNGADPSGGPGAEGSRERLREHTREMRSEGQALAEAAQGAAGELAALSRHSLEQSPYLTLGAALAAGYVLGGGLSSRLVATAAGIGSRAAVAVLARELVEGARRGAEAAADPAPDV